MTTERRAPPNSGLAPFFCAGPLKCVIWTWQKTDARPQNVSANCWQTQTWKLFLFPIMNIVNIFIAHGSYGIGYYMYNPHHALWQWWWQVFASAIEFLNIFKTTKNYNLMFLRTLHRNRVLIISICQSRETIDLCPIVQRLLWLWRPIREWQ